MSRPASRHPRRRRAGRRRTSRGRDVVSDVESDPASEADDRQPLTGRGDRTGEDRGPRGRGGQRPEEGGRADGRERPQQGPAAERRGLSHGWPSFCGGISRNARNCRHHSARAAWFRPGRMDGSGKRTTRSSGRRRSVRVRPGLRLELQRGNAGHRDLVWEGAASSSRGFCSYL